MSQSSTTLLCETRRSATRRSRRGLSIGTLVSICTLYLLSIEDETSLVGYSTDGVGSRLSTTPSHGYCPAWVPPFADVRDLYIMMRLKSCVLQHYLQLSSGCVFTSFDRVGTVGMERGFSWSCVPFQTVCVHTEFPGNRATDLDRK